MKRIFVFVLTAVFVAGFATAALAQRQTTTMERGTTAQGLPEVSEGTLVTQKATIEAIDPATRKVTLKTPDGKTAEVKLGPEVKNFSQLKVGDQVTARYYEAVAVAVRQPGQPGGPAMSETEAMGRAKPGEKPAGVMARQITINTTIESIAPDKKSVTLKGPSGNSMKVAVRDPKNLQNVKAGDQVDITYTEAWAVSVEKGRA